MRSWEHLHHMNVENYLRALFLTLKVDPFTFEGRSRKLPKPWTLGEPMPIPELIDYLSSDSSRDWHGFRKCCCWRCLDALSEPAGHLTDSASRYLALRSFSEGDLCFRNIYHSVFMFFGEYATYIGSGRWSYNSNKQNGGKCSISSSISTRPQSAILSLTNHTASPKLSLRPLTNA